MNFNDVSNIQGDVLVLNSCAKWIVAKGKSIIKGGRTNTRCASCGLVNNDRVDSVLDLYLCFGFDLGKSCDESCLISVPKP